VQFFQVLESDDRRVLIESTTKYISPGRLVEMDLIANNSLGENGFEIQYRAGKETKL